MLDLITFVVVGVEDTVPEDEDVVAGPWGALMFVLLIGATIFLCFSFVKQLRKTRANRDAGAFGPTDSAAATGTGFVYDDPRRDGSPDDAPNDSTPGDSTSSDTGSSDGGSSGGDGGGDGGGGGD